MKSTSLFVLVNRSPTNEITSFRGIRHGDRMAFFIVTEGLAGLARQTAKKQLFKGISIGRIMYKLICK